jgi:hypothetical protein
MGRCGTEPAGEYTFFYGKENGSHELGIDLFIHKRMISAVKRVEFFSDRMSYIILRARWCDIIILNVIAPTEDIIVDMKERFYEKQEHVFDKFPKYHIKIMIDFPKYHIKIMIEDFNAKIGREDIFKPTTGNECLHEIGNDTGFIVVNFAISKHLTSKIQWSHIVTFINLLDVS